MTMSDERASAAPGRQGRSSSSAGVGPSSEALDEIQERYLKRAIDEINALGDELLGLGDELHVPVLGSGHPLGDVFLLKYRPTASEIHEGVALFGRAGQALLKSLTRTLEQLRSLGSIDQGSPEPATVRAVIERIEREQR